MSSSKAVEEVLEYKKEIKKHIKDDDKVLQLLNLISKVKVTISDIKEIKLAGVLKKLKESKNPKILENVEKLISSWKKILYPKKKEDDALPEEYLIKDEKASKRNNIRKTLFKFLKSSVKEEEIDDLMKKIVEIEEKLFELKKDESSYINRGLEIIHNIKDENNVEFREKIVKGEITPEELCKMNALDMMSKEKKKEREIMVENKVNEDRSDWNEKHATATEGVYKCRACGGTKTKQAEMQTRSADEPMTLYITCLNCGKTWRG